MVPAHNAAEEFDDIDKMLGKISVDAVCLAMPIHLNAPCAIKTLKAGFHTFCEKPVANSIEDALELQKIVEETGLIYQVGFELRNSPLIQAVMNQINSGRIGQVTAISGYHYWKPNAKDVNARMGNWHYDKFGGNVLFDCMSHTFDLVNYFTGSTVESVFADNGYVTDEFKDRKVPEVGGVVIRYKNGVRASISFTETCDMPHSTKFTIAGSAGKIEIEFAGVGCYRAYYGGGGYLEEAIDPATTTPGHLRSEERRVGKECRSRWSPDH